jgi:predicted DNA-binding protein
MSNTLTVRLPDELLQQLRRRARRMGLPVGRVVRNSIENTLSEHENLRLLEFAGLIKAGPRDLSSRKGFSRKLRRRR